MSRTLFISDLHFGHKNGLAFDARPFKDIVTHDAELIRRWNQAVDIDDTVWILGDISWYGSAKTIQILEQLNGVKCLCRGNHDSKLLRNGDVRKLFAEICDYKEVGVPDVGGSCVVLCHYPIPCFNNHFYNWYHLYGHVHNSFEYNMMQRMKYEMEELYGKPCRMYNVGAMLGYMDYTPRTLEEIISNG